MYTRLSLTSFALLFVTIVLAAVARTAIVTATSTETVEYSTMANAAPTADHATGTPAIYRTTATISTTTDGIVTTVSPTTVHSLPLFLPLIMRQIVVTILPPQIADFSPDPRPASSMGSASAPVIMYEWSDYTEPDSKRFHDEVLPLLEETYIGAGQLLYVYKEYPVVGGDLAYVASLAGQCAGLQDKFWNMHDWLFVNVVTWKNSDAIDHFKAVAAELGLDEFEFGNCVDEQTPRDLVVADYGEGQQYGVIGAPYFIINGHSFPGFLPIDRYSEVIDALIVGDNAFVTATPTSTPDITFEDEEYAVMGNPSAPVTIVAFNDYQCPYCRRHFDQTMPLLIENYIEPGKVRYVLKDFTPTLVNPQYHPQAITASLAAECAGEQDSYWKMHNKLFNEPERWSNVSSVVAVFKKFAAELTLNTVAFNTCIDTEAYLGEISADYEEGLAARVSGTPSFYINDIFVSGAQPYEVFEQIIESELDSS